MFQIVNTEATSRYRVELHSIFTADADFTDESRRLDFRRAIEDFLGNMECELIEYP